MKDILKLSVFTMGVVVTLHCLVRGVVMTVLGEDAMAYGSYLLGTVSLCLTAGIWRALVQDLFPEDYCNECECECPEED
jgi:hypothetical protein